MKKLIVFVAVAYLLHLASAVKWKDCGSKEGKIKDVHVTNCDKTPACTLKKGTNVTFAVDFIPTEMVSKATAVVHGVVRGIPIPFPVQNPNACKDSGLTCPLKPNVSVSYRAVLQIKDAYPSINCIVKWELKDQNSNDIFCILVPVHISS